MAKLVLIVLGIVHIVNGVWMLASPMSWYAAIPGVAETGPLNHHFVEDVGLAFLASGAGLLIGSRKEMAACAIAGATWPVLHALLHIWGWIAHGLPAHADIILSDAIGVVFVGALGAWAAFSHASNEGAVP